MRSRNYNREFKLNAMKLYESSGKKASEICRDLGISFKITCPKKRITRTMLELSVVCATIAGVSAYVAKLMFDNLLKTHRKYDF